MCNIVIDFKLIECCANLLLIGNTDKRAQFDQFFNSERIRMHRQYNKGVFAQCQLNMSLHNLCC